ncbi:MAG: 50S ribosomal protein L10 [Planctomycetota bacterium]|nr:50S ribosomal protein L10 [Planctomycetota bacterium]
MPSRVNRLVREKLVAEYRDRSGLVFVSNQGLNGEEMTELRREVRSGGFRMRVVRTRLAKLALKEIGVENSDILFRGPTAVLDGDDPVATARLAEQLAKKYPRLGLIGALVEGRVLGEDGVKALAKSPSRRQLQGAIVGQIKGPAGQVSAAVSAPGARVAAALAALIGKLEKAGQDKGSDAGNEPAPAGA